MSGQHTQGRLVAVIVRDGRAYLAPCEGPPQTVIAAYISEEDARRLAACWNACEGLTTEQVEELASGSGAAGSLRCIDELRGFHKKSIAETDAARAGLAAARALLTDVYVIGNLDIGDAAAKELDLRVNAFLKGGA